MRPAIPLSICFLSAVLPAAAVDHLTVLGDSLTKEYQVTYPGLPPLVEGIDATNPGARNWAEILNNFRNANFDSGEFKNAAFVNMWKDMRLLGHEYNWAVPGATARTIRNLLTDPNGTEIGNDADFTQLKNFAQEWQQTGPRLTAQVSTTSAAAVIWCGGNDLRFGTTDPAATVSGEAIRYETIYNGDGTGAGNPAPLMNSIKASVQTIAQYVKTANPSLPIVVCAVPHVGCTPEVKGLWPTDPVRTGRITTALETLNADLKTWTETTLGGAWVDTYGMTKDLIDHGFTLGGVTFINGSDVKTAGDPVSAHNRYVFSHDGFHPTSTLQAVVAQKIQAALAVKYPAKFGASTPLTDREVLSSVLTIPVNTGYNEFMSASGAPVALQGADLDADGDGLANIVEFALAGNAAYSASAPALPVSSLDNSGQTPTLVMTWIPRYASNVFAAITCQQSSALNLWTDVPAGQISANPDGSVTARVPRPASGPLFLRLKVTSTP